MHSCALHAINAPHHTPVLHLQESADPRSYATYLASRPPRFEQDAAHLLIDTLVEEHVPPTPGFFLHIAHLSDASNVEGYRVSE
jgi:hypothetical protein